MAYYCKDPMCSELTETPPYCDEHRPAKTKHQPSKKSAEDTRIRNKFYHSKKWRSFRKSILAKEPLCRECSDRQFFFPATVVDHILPISEGGEPFDPKNMQPLCVSCHNRKSLRERKNKKDITNYTKKR